MSGINYNLKPQFLIGLSAPKSLTVESRLVGLGFEKIGNRSIDTGFQWWKVEKPYLTALVEGDIILRALVIGPPEQASPLDSASDTSFIQEFLNEERLTRLFGKNPNGWGDDPILVTELLTYNPNSINEFFDALKKIFSRFDQSDTLQVA